MSSKIEMIDIGERSFPVSMFPENVKALVIAYELSRDKFNSATIEAKALEQYTAYLGQTIHDEAVKALEEMTGNNKQAAPAYIQTSEDAVEGRDASL